MSSSNNCTDKYNSVLSTRSLQIHIVSFLPLSTVFVSFVCCNVAWNNAWKSVCYDKELIHNFYNQYGRNTLSILGYQWPNNPDWNGISNDGSATPISIGNEKTPLAAIKNVQINNNRDMIKTILTNWIFVNQYNPDCAGGMKCGFRYAELYIDFLRRTGNANFVFHWALRVCICCICLSFH